MTKKLCRECGVVPSEKPTGRSGRCEDCGIARMMLVWRLNGVSANMTNAQLEELLSTLESQYGRGGQPRRLPRQVRAA